MIHYPPRKRMMNPPIGRYALPIRSSTTARRKNSSKSRLYHFREDRMWGKERERERVQTVFRTQKETIYSRSDCAFPFIIVVLCASTRVFLGVQETRYISERSYDIYIYRLAFKKKKEWSHAYIAISLILLIVSRTTSEKKKERERK